MIVQPSMRILESKITAKKHLEKEKNSSSDPKKTECNLLYYNERLVWETAMESVDLIGRARTGTGKTMVSGIPIMDEIIKFNAKHEGGIRWRLFWLRTENSRV